MNMMQRGDLALYKKQEQRIAQLEQHNEKVQRMILDYKQRERGLRERVEYALKLLGDAGSNSEHDPSWIRPKKLTREQVNECCIQAYHVLHQALTPSQKEGES